MSEIILVLVIVAIVAVPAGRSLYRTMTGRKDGWEYCSHCHGCLCRNLAKAASIRNIDK